MAVTLDAIGPNATGATQLLSVASPLTWSHTIGGANRFVLIGIAVGIKDGPPHALGAADRDMVITSVTLGGLPCFSIGRIIRSNEAGGFASGYVALYGMVAPPAGVQTVNVNYTIANINVVDSIEAGSLSFNGVDQYTPFRSLSAGTGLGVLPTVTVPSVAGNMVVDILASGSGIVSSNQTNRWLRNVNTSSSGGNGAMSTAVGAASVVMSYNVASDNWGIVALDIQAVGVKRNGLTMGVDNF